MVASDRISAYDFVLDTTIPDKGEILTRMSLWWFDQLADLVPHHVMSTDVPERSRAGRWSARSWRCIPSSASPAATSPGPGCWTTSRPARCAGSRCRRAWWTAVGCRPPIFTPATKAALGDHDENVSYESVVSDIGADVAAELRDLTLAVYARAEGLARERGIILADTKFEFGTRLGTGDGAAAGTTVARRRGAHPRLEPLLAGRRVGAGSRPELLRQADRAQLAALRGERLGPLLGTAPPRRCPPRSSTAPAVATSRPSSCSPGSGSDGARGSEDAGWTGRVRRTGRGGLRLPRRPAQPAGVAVLAAQRGDARRRVSRGSACAGATTPSSGLVPQMEITELEPDELWAENGRWRGVIEADPDAGLRAHRDRMHGRRAVPGRVVAACSRPVGWAATGAGAARRSCPTYAGPPASSPSGGS